MSAIPTDDGIASFMALVGLTLRELNPERRKFSLDRLAYHVRLARTEQCGRVRAF